MGLNEENSLSHLLDHISPEIENETTLIEHSKYYNDVEFKNVLQNTNNKISMLSLNCQQLPTIVILTNIPYPPLFLTMYYYSCMYSFIVYFHSCPSSISFAQLLNSHLGRCISYIRLILTTSFLASFIVIIHVSAMQLLCIAYYDYG